MTKFEKYLDESLKVVLDLMSREGSQIVPLETLYFGGGTPSLWGQEGIDFINHWFKKNGLNLADKYEWTLEVDPGTTTDIELKNWKNLGVNRYSVGVQTFNSQIFPLMDRSHSFADIGIILEKLSQLNLNFSVDFMLGLPNSETLKRDIIEELKAIMQFSPKHISLYFLTVPTQYSLFKNLPQDEWIEREYRQVNAYLLDKGFNHYEVASFALPGFESKHNHRYWNHSSVLALGPSATGFFNGNHRFKWLTNWGEDIKPTFNLEILSKEELELEKIYLTLRKGIGFSTEDLARYGLDPIKLTQFFERWHRLGYCQDQAKKWKMTPAGWIILDTLVQELLTLKK